MTSIKIYDGPSLLDGARIIVILTGLGARSRNAKTGDMLQTWIMRHDVKPNDAQQSGADASVCGQCPLRPMLHAASPAAPKPCYVRTFQAPRAVWAAHRDKPTTELSTLAGIVGGRLVRRGSYGDPSAVPAAVWDALSASRGTGYTHQWRSGRLADTVMASVHTEAERQEARALGYRTFRVMAPGDTLGTREIACPASKEAGALTTCEKCGLCNGSRGPGDKRADIAIMAH